MNFGDSFYLSPKSSSKSALGSGAGNTGDFLIVNKMLLTGFDAPRLKRLYLCRKLDGHDLLQALTRVNRPYRDFRYGYVVDFADIKENFVETNNRYLKELHDAIYGRDAEDDFDDGTNPGVLLASKEEIEEKLQNLKDALFLYDIDNKEVFRKQLDAEMDKSHLLYLRRTLEESKALMNQIRSFGDDELKEKVRNLAPDAVPQFLSEVNHRIERMNLLDGLDRSEDVSGIINEALSQMEFTTTSRTATRTSATSSRPTSTTTRTGTSTCFRSSRRSSGSAVSRRRQSPRRRRRSATWTA